MAASEAKADTSYQPKVGDSLDRLDTPSMIVDLDLMEANIDRLFARLRPSGVLVRPHLKTTKSAALARRLAAAGARGGCVAKLAEAEALCAAGFDDLLITCEIVGAVKARRLARLYRRHPRLRVVVDSEAGAKGLDDALEEEVASGGGAPLPPLATLIDVDVGLNRTGVPPGEPALQLARYVRAHLRHLRVIGVQGYEGHLQHLHDAEERRAQCLASMRALVDTAQLLRGDGFEVAVVTTGGTGTAEVCASVDGVTEVQPGSFIFMDTDYRNALGEGVYANSLSILSTVLSRRPGRAATIDSGLKSLTTDSGLAECRDGRYAYGVLGDEHGSLSWGEGTPELRVGDRVEMLPSHIDPTINLHDYYYAHRGGVIEEIWRVDARGKVQ